MSEKFERLFSQDPLMAFEKIEEHYDRYFEIAFKLDKEDYLKLDEERMKTLKSNNNRSKEPYIEILPEYVPAEGVNSIQDLASKFEDAFGGEKISQQYFDFVSKGLMNYRPYGHQVGMMDKAFAGKGENGESLKYKNTVITSGTGSGKTEAFLLPLLADIFKEAQAWPDAKKSHAGWFENGNGKYIPCQRDGDTRPAAIRALVLYPMNALVEDQMARLRKALDSDAVRNFMKNNRIYFGSYNGSTIGKKSYDLLKEAVKNGDIQRGKFNKKKEEVGCELRKISENYTSICNYYKNHTDREDALYISPRLDSQSTTAEMITRWDMQNWPPDILITNTSMLSIMLMRKAEAPMIEQTRRWLAAEDLPEEKREEAKKDRVFHVVVDELHLYRGTSGSEVACLLRMLYGALGLDPVVDDGSGNKIPNPQIKILASSASFGADEEIQKFMEEFFGVYNTTGEPVFNIQHGANYHGINNENITIDYTKFDVFTHENFVALEDDPDGMTADEQRAKILNDFVTEKFESIDVKDFVDKYQEQIFYDFYHVLPENKDHTKRPISQSELVKMFGTEAALRGFLIFRGYIDNVVKGHKLPRFRFHKFFKYVEGLWGELQPTVPAGKDPNKDAVTNLSYKADEVGPNGRKVLELLRCETCGKLFIGGNRKIGQNGSTYLTLNYPDLERIPNFNPTPMVQNKSYHDYAIFWPQKIQNTDVTIREDDQDGWKGWKGDHVVNMRTREWSYANTTGQAEWIPGYLDARTGKFTDINHALAGNGQQLKQEIAEHGIEGFLYKINRYGTQTDIVNDDIASNVFAAPCTCPYCKQDYTMRKYTNSPIRSFRTGIDRSNELLSKEILYQLDEKSSKLIGFSDSREDAAKQALGIDKEHYRDMVRMLFVDCVNDVNDYDIQPIVDFVKEELGKGVDFGEIVRHANQRWFRNDMSMLCTYILLAELGKTTLDKYKTSDVPLNDFISEGGKGTLVRKLLKCGVNPAGEAYRYQWYKKKDNKDKLFHWSTAYDFDEYQMLNDPGFADDNYKGEIITQLRKAVFDNSFGKYMGVSTLDAGIGYISCPRTHTESPEFTALKKLLGKNDNEVYDFIDAFIRVMGDNYMYEGMAANDRIRTVYSEFPKAVKRPISKYCNENNIDENKLGDALVNFIKHIGQLADNENVLLKFSSLAFTMKKESQYIECPTCGRVHPNMGFGFCTNTCCMESLENANTVEAQELHEHYISHDILIEKRQPKKLHTEELSGQTDDIQSRLRDFKDLIISNSKAEQETRPIDMLCVTTTMEVGVDIGSLQAIFQGNMPPTRYNYQQRVGRGGRRGQAYSAAFTFCRGRSHDVYYYNKATDEMVGGIPATPKLSLAPYTDTDDNQKMKTSIMKRVVAKEVLHEAFIDLPFKYDLIDTAGEFGFVEEWNRPDFENDNKNKLDTWIKNNNKKVEAIVHRYFDQFNLKNQIDNDIEEIINWINRNLVDQIDAAVGKTSNYGEGLATFLSETGFLPMYGMPSDVRNFYHGYDDVKHELRSIDRSSEMAISEFAPGAEKTKDKGKYRVEGLTLPMKVNSYNNAISFYNDNGDALSDCYKMTFEDDKVNGNIHHIDGYQLNTENTQQDAKNWGLDDKDRLLVIPQAYRSLKIKGNTGTPIENNDRGTSFVQCQVFAQESEDKRKANLPPKEIGNVKVSVYGMNLYDDPIIWHVNNNNGRYYRGSYGANGLTNPIGKSKNFLFYYENVNTIYPQSNGQEIALGSKKVTQMIKLELKSLPETLDLNVSTGNRSAIRAAFYSAAFLLQRALADKLDVEPDEIEICEKIDDNHCPVIYLSDALANGADIVSHLYQEGKLKDLITRIVNFDSFDSEKTAKEKSFMQSLISEEHRKECLTACQQCLMTYSNRGYHHVLDWRLGVGILRLMLDPNYDFGFDEGNREKYEELKDYDNIVKACCTKLGIDNNGEEGKYIYHPLWNREKVNEKSGQNINEYYNTFRVLRSDLQCDDSPTQTNSNPLGREKAKNVKQQTKSQGDSQEKVSTGETKAVDVRSGIILGAQNV